MNTTVFRCQICGQETLDEINDTAICAACRVAQLNGQTARTGELPIDFTGFKKQTDELPGAFSDAVMERVRTETNAPALFTTEAVEPSWSLASGFFVWLFSFVAIIFFGILSQFIWFANQQLNGRPITQEAAQTSESFLVLFALSNFPAHLCSLLVAWLVVTRSSQKPFFETLGWFWPKNFRPWHAVIFTLVMLFGIGYLAVRFLPEAENNFTKIIKSFASIRYIFAAIAVLTAPIVEEVVYRGALYAPLERKFGVAWAVTIVSLIFAAVHVPQYWPSIATITVILSLSIGLTIIRAATKSLLPCVFIHVLFNAIQVISIIFGRN